MESEGCYIGRSWSTRGDARSSVFLRSARSRPCSGSKALTRTGHSFHAHQLGGSLSSATNAMHRISGDHSWPGMGESVRSGASFSLSSLSSSILSLSPFTARLRPSSLHTPPLPPSRSPSPTTVNDPFSCAPWSELSLPTTTSNSPGSTTHLKSLSTSLQSADTFSVITTCTASSPSTCTRTNPLSALSGVVVDDTRSVRYSCGVSVPGVGEVLCRMKVTVTREVAVTWVGVTLRLE